MDKNNSLKQNQNGNNKVQVQKRNTIQKKLVLEAVHQLQNHPTAEEVYNHIIKIYKNISKGTVYRNLNILVEEEKLIKVLVNDGADRFDHNTFDHNHIKCDICQRCYDIPRELEKPLDNILDIEKSARETSGFIVNSYEILFRGVCPTCRAAMSKKN